MLGIDVSQTGLNVRLALTGRLTIDSSPELRTRLLGVLRQEPAPSVSVDLEQVAYIDSSGLVTLIEALKVAHTRRTTLTVEGLQGRILRILQTTGLLDLFDANGTITESAAAKVY